MCINIYVYKLLFEKLSEKFSARVYKPPCILLCDHVLYELKILSESVLIQTARN